MQSYWSSYMFNGTLYQLWSWPCYN